MKIYVFVLNLKINQKTQPKIQIANLIDRMENIIAAVKVEQKCF